MALKLTSPKRARRWVALIEGRAERPRKATCRPPTDIERLAASGYTRRVDGQSGAIWYEHSDGRTTPRCATLGEATKAALEAIERRGR